MTEQIQNIFSVVGAILAGFGTVAATMLTTYKQLKNQMKESLSGDTEIKQQLRELTEMVLNLSKENEELRQSYMEIKEQYKELKTQYKELKALVKKYIPEVEVIKE